jgi:hypothetical protein
VLGGLLGEGFGCDVCTMNVCLVSDGWRQHLMLEMFWCPGQLCTACDMPQVLQSLVMYLAEVSRVPWCVAAAVFFFCASPAGRWWECGGVAVPPWWVSQTCTPNCTPIRRLVLARPTCGLDRRPTPGMVWHGLLGWRLLYGQRTCGVLWSLLMPA